MGGSNFRGDPKHGDRPICGQLRLKYIQLIIKVSRKISNQDMK